MVGVVSRSMAYGRNPATSARTLGIAPARWRMPLVPRGAMVTAAAAATVIDTMFADYSAWDRDTFDAACFRDQAGVRRAWVQFDSNGDAATEALQGAGIDVLAGYGFPYFSAVGTQPQAVIAHVTERCVAHGIPVVCIDAEMDNTASPPTVARRVQQMRECVAIVRQAGLIPWIYSAPWWWVPNMGNTPEFAEAGVLYVNANYGRNDGTLGPIREMPAGYAWAYCIAHQRWSLANYCGRTARDVSYLWDDGLPGGAPMTAAEQAAFDALAARTARLERIVAGYGTLPVMATADNLAILQGIKGPGVTPGIVVNLTGEETLRYMDADQSNLELGVALLEQRVAKLEAIPPGSIPADVQAQIAKVYEDSARALTQAGAAIRQAGTARTSNGGK